MKSPLASLPLKTKSVTKFQFLCTYLYAHTLPLPIFSLAQTTKDFCQFPIIRAIPLNSLILSPKPLIMPLVLSSSPALTPPNLSSRHHTYTCSHEPTLIIPAASLAVFCLHAFAQVIWLRPGLPWVFKQKGWTTGKEPLSGPIGSMVQLNIRPHTDTQLCSDYGGREPR